MTAKAKIQLASGNVGRVLRRAVVAGGTDPEAEAEPAAMGDCKGVGLGGRGSEERGGEASRNTVSSGSSSSCCKSWLLAPNKLPDSAQRGLSAGALPCRAEGTRLCDDLLCVPTGLQDACPAALGGRYWAPTVPMSTQG